MARILKLPAGAPAVEPEVYRLPASRRVAGDPQQMVWLEHSGAGGRFSVGVWASGVGCWRVIYTEEEYCRILEGVSIVTADGGEPLMLRAGDEFVVPAGFVGTWEVVEPTRKRFVVFEDGG